MRGGCRGAPQPLVDSKLHYFGVSNYSAWRIAETVALCRAMGVPKSAAA